MPNGTFSIVPHCCVFEYIYTYACVVVMRAYRLAHYYYMIGRAVCKRRLFRVMSPMRKWHAAFGIFLWRDKTKTKRSLDKDFKIHTNDARLQAFNR